MQATSQVCVRVCVCFFCVCTSLVTSACRLDLKTPRSKGWKKDAEEEGDGEEVGRGQK